MAIGVHQKKNRKRDYGRLPSLNEEDFWDTLCLKYNEENHWKKPVGRPKKNECNRQPNRRKANQTLENG